MDTKTRTIMQRTFFELIALSALVILCCFMSSCADTSGKSKEAFAEALAADEDMLQGVIPSDYTNESPYTFKSIECIATEQLDEGVASADLSAVIENESFESTLTVKGTFLQGNPKDDGSYLFDLVDSSTVPKKGVDYTYYQNEQISVDSSLEEGTISKCSVEIPSTSWCFNGQPTMEYTYAFDGRDGWKQSEEKLSYKFANLDGDYLAKTGDLTSLSMFKISNLDPTAGTFDVEYEATVNAVNEIFGRKEIVVHGFLQGTLDPSGAGGGLFNTGSNLESVYFEGKGNSDSGEGQAAITGNVYESLAGEKAIDITLAFDHASTKSWAVNEDTVLDTSWTTRLTGTLYKQE